MKLSGHSESQIIRILKDHEAVLLSPIFATSMACRRLGSLVRQEAEEP